jgi:magnesium transporter
VPPSRAWEAEPTTAGVDVTILHPVEILIRDPKSGAWGPNKDLSEFPPGKRDPLLWADVDHELNLHPLAIEDALNPRQRPKLESYPEHLFLVLHQLDDKDGQLESAQIACFIGSNFVLTVHDSADRLVEAARARWDRECGEIEDQTVGNLAYVLLDTIVDDYQEIADDLETKTEEMEEIVLAAPTAPVQRQIYELKQKISRLRRYSIPLHRALDYVLGGNASHVFASTTHELMSDVNDHVLRIADQVRSIEDLTNAVLDLNRQAQAESLNEVNKKLSGWAAIFGVAAIIAGIYGMNYGLVPEINGTRGFWFAIALIVVCATGMYVYFKKKDWL